MDEKRLIQNLELLKKVEEEGPCRILLAQKAFSMFSVYPLIRKYLVGSTASGLYEARLGKEEFGGETHVFSPAYREDEFEELLTYADHLVFNSPSQLRKYSPRARALGKRPAFGSILNAPPRKAMPSMIPVLRVPAWGLHWNSLRKNCCLFWMACIFIRSANRILMI